MVREWCGLKSCFLCRDASTWYSLVKVAISNVVRIIYCPFTEGWDHQVVAPCSTSPNMGGLFFGLPSLLYPVTGCKRSIASREGHPIPIRTPCCLHVGARPRRCIAEWTHFFSLPGKSMYPCVQPYSHQYQLVLGIFFPPLWTQRHTKADGFACQKLASKLVF